MAVISKDLGPVSAYAVAVANGFTGTEAEWEQYIANASTAAQSAAGSATAAANSAAGAAQSATAAAASQVAAAGSETEAANYALVAGNHAMAAAASATAAETAETGAETAQAAAEAAQAAAEAVAESIPEDYTELTEEVGSLKRASIIFRNTLTPSDDFNNITEPGTYRWNAANSPAGNNPSPGKSGCLINCGLGSTYSDNHYMQYLYSDNYVYYRLKLSSWSAWVKITSENDTAIIRKLVSDLPINSNDYYAVNDISAYTIAKYYDATGNEYDGGTNYLMTDLVPCYGMRAISFKSYKYKTASLAIAYIVFFDANKSFIGSIYPVDANGSGTVELFCAIPDNAYYFSAFARPNTPSPYVILHKDSVQVNLTDILHGSTTIYKYDGTTTTATNWYTTGFVYVDGFKSVSFLGGGYHSGTTVLETLTFFDANGTRVGGVLTNVSNNNPRAGKATIKIPSNAKYVKLLNNTTMTDTPYLILHNPEHDPINVLCIGDSITEGYIQGNAIANEPYPFVMQKTLGIDYAVLNAGVGGSNAGTYWETYKKFLNIASADVVIIMFGLNGGMGNTFDTDVDPYDDYDDYASTITGFTCKLVEWIQEQAPNALIVFATPTYAGADTANEVQAKKQIENLPGLVSRYHVPVINIRDDLGINEKNLSHWMATDKVHGKDGNFYRKLGLLFANQLKTIVNIP